MTQLSHKNWLNPWVWVSGRPVSLVTVRLTGKAYGSNEQSRRQRVLKRAESPPPMSAPEFPLPAWRVPRRDPRFVLTASRQAFSSLPSLSVLMRSPPFDCERPRPLFGFIAGQSAVKFQDGRGTDSKTTATPPATPHQHHITQELTPATRSGNDEVFGKCLDGIASGLITVMSRGRMTSSRQPTARHSCVEQERSRCNTRRFSAVEDVSERIEDLSDIPDAEHGRPQCTDEEP